MPLRAFFVLEHEQLGYEVEVQSYVAMPLRAFFVLEH